MPDPLERSTAAPAPRGRRRWRWLVMVSLLVVLVTIGTLLAFALKVMYAKPGGDAGYAAAMEALASEYQSSDGENGLELIELLTEERKRLEADVDGKADAWFDYQSIEPRYEPLVEPVEVTRARALSVLGRYSTSRMPALWARLVVAKRFARDWPDGPLGDVLMADHGYSRALARMNGGRMYLGAEQANWNEVVKPYEETLALARLLSHDTTLISRLIANAIQSKADMDLRHILIERRMSPEVLQQLIATHERQAITTPASLAFRGEKLYFADCVQRTHTDNGRGDGRLIVTEFAQKSGMESATPWGGAKNHRIYNLLGLLAASKKQVLAKADSHFDLVATLIDVPRHTRDATHVRSAEYFVESLKDEYTVIGAVLPATFHAFRSHDQIRTEHTGIRLVLEIELFRAQHSRLPESLDELVKDLSAEAAATLLTDPFTGKRFGFRVLDKPEPPAEGVPFGRDYLLYSFGRDGVDNRGSEANVSGEPFAALHDPEGRGFDLVINRPRPLAKRE